VNISECYVALIKDLNCIFVFAKLASMYRQPRLIDSAQRTMDKLNKAWQSNTISVKSAEGKSFTQGLQEDLCLVSFISLINDRKQFSPLQLVIK